MTTKRSKNGAITMSRINSSGYVLRHGDYIQLNAYYTAFCLAIALGLGLK